MALSFIILTFNEEQHLPQLLNSIKELNAQVYLVDSGSTDATLKIAEEFGAVVMYHKWENNYAKQFNWGLENLPIKTEWVFRIDADEYLTPELVYEIKEKLPNLPNNITGVILNRRHIFLGKWIKRGIYPVKLLRLFRYKKAICEQRWMDEHIKVDGLTILSGIDVLESNYDRQKNIALWTDKHNKYSTREAIDFLIQKHKLNRIDTIAKFRGNKTERKRWLKEKFYFNLPLLLRPFLYYIHRYFFKLGFLDGKEGFIFHFLHAFWYRFLVDVKVYQLEQLAKKENKIIPEVIKEYYGIEV